MTETPWPEVQPELTDGVVSLRPWRADDAQWVYESCQDPEVQRWTRVAVPYLMKDAEGFVGPFASHQWSSGNGAPFAVIDTESGLGIGAAGFIINDPTSRVAEAGYWTSAMGAVLLPSIPTWSDPKRCPRCSTVSRRVWGQFLHSSCATVSRLTRGFSTPPRRVSIATSR